MTNSRIRGGEKELEEENEGEGLRKLEKEKIGKRIRKL
jgi:hypothetical protein